MERGECTQFEEKDSEPIIRNNIVKSSQINVIADEKSFEVNIATFFLD